ncbi:SHOCT domain-containing protein [Neorhodopirellula pilleata]|uniref:SHOCT domain-containing protein n=1 Tax=Neorhodopirellula pilleata TaxID=2714738 RepID=A0A5C6AB32_9BACT|nr:SHOCT domain-containing protein [Neorhodopirellula pilleata]TWT95543.1 hypothetical protein Pla100_31840 [Neorhodopirellula pilleata]
MSQLTSAGEQLVQQLSQRHGVSTDAITHMLIAVQNGNGSMAQFNHPEFGGCGQWMQGGMTMVSDLFNNALKSRVDNVCSDIANHLAQHQTTPYVGSFQSQSQGGNHNQTQASGAMGGNDLFAPDPNQNWWPQDLGGPSATGSQNDVAYAYFSGSCRLAVKTGGDVWVYDTMDHQIGGFGQQQGVGGTITFSSQYGTVNLSTLPVVSINGTAPAPVSPTTPSPESSGSATPPIEHLAGGNAPTTDEDDVIAKLERLGQLKDKGYLSDEEFASKKSELLARL